MTQAAQDVSRELDDQLKARGLPTSAFIDNRSDKSTGAAPVIAVRRGERGYYQIFTQQTAQELNAAHGVSEAQAQAMHIGSMRGWDLPGADPRKWETTVLARARTQR